MIRTLGRRLLEIALVIWGAATITFLAVQAIPGDPVSIISGGENIVDAEQREAITARYGLDRPLAVQYFTYLLRVFTGEFGESYVFREDVLTVLADAAGPTVELAFSGFSVGVLIAVTAALVTAGSTRAYRTLTAVAELLLLSIPTYWIGIMLLLVFSFWLGWFPVTGTQGLSTLVLPAITLGLTVAPVLAQVLRDGLERALEEPFALTVRSRGVGEAALRLRHAFRHSLLAVSTISGTLLGGVLTGSILTETVFGRAGIGQVTLMAIGSRDMPLILGIVVIAALIYSLVNLGVDIGYRLIDPRLRQGADL